MVSGLVLEHLDHLDDFFREARRVLRPDGLAFISAMHPAMFLRGTQAQFTDPESGERVRPGSRPTSSATSSWRPSGRASRSGICARTHPIPRTRTIPAGREVCRVADARDDGAGGVN